MPDEVNIKFSPTYVCKNKFSSPNATTAVKLNSVYMKFCPATSAKKQKINVKNFCIYGTKVWNEQIDRHENKNSPFKQQKKDVTRR